MAKCDEDKLNGGYVISGIKGCLDIRIQPDGEEWRVTIAKGGSAPGYGSTRAQAVRNFLKNSDARILTEALAAIENGCPD